MSAEMELFQPKRPDGRATWRVILDWIVEEVEARRLAVGDIIRHDTLMNVLDSSQDSAYYSAISKATTELQRRHGRSLVSVRGAGYKLVSGMGQLAKGEGHVERSRREFRKGLDTVQHIDDGELKLASDRQLVDKIRVGMIAIAGVLQMQADKVAEHEEQLAEIKSSRLDDRARARATEDEVAELKRRLARLETQG